MNTYTKGNIIVEDIKIGDIHYEFEHNVCIKSEVLTIPDRSEEGYWTWESKQLSNGEIIHYGVHEKYVHYGPNLYDNKVYINCKMI